VELQAYYTQLLKEKAKARWIVENKIPPQIRIKIRTNISRKLPRLKRMCWQTLSLLIFDETYQDIEL
jgi:hypothetical protein